MQLMIEPNCFLAIKFKLNTYIRMYKKAIEENEYLHCLLVSVNRMDRSLLNVELN